MKAIGQEGGLVNRIDTIDVTPECQQKLPEGMIGRAKVTETAEVAL